MQRKYVLRANLCHSKSLQVLHLACKTSLLTVKANLCGYMY